MRNALALLLLVVIGVTGWFAWRELSPKPKKVRHVEEVVDEPSEPGAEPRAAAAPASEEAREAERLRTIAAAARHAAELRGNTAPSDGKSGRPAQAQGNAGGAVASPSELPTPDGGVRIIEPPETATDPSDKSARLAAETYKTVIKAMKLQPEQEQEFKQVLYDTKTAYNNALKAAESVGTPPAEGDKADPDPRATALAQLADARKKAWDDQKLVADEKLKDVLSDDQFRIYSIIVQNPLFMANGLRFEDPAPAPAAPAP